MIPIEELKAQLAVLNDQLAKLRKEISDDYAPRAEQVSKRRRAVGLVLITLALSFTLNNATISRCFLGPPSAGIERRVCAVVFPGFEQARRQADVRLQQFTALVRAIPESSARSQANQRELDELQRRVAKLEAPQRRR